MKNSYDVIIAGSGISASTTSMILAKNGLNVLMIEAKKHPRFAIGEALLPQSSMWMWIVGEYFDIPEIQYLSDADQVVDHVTPACGIKHSIGFAYHQKSQPFTGEHGHQLIPPHLPFYSESHFVREDIDHYLVKSAIEYGVDYVDMTKITDVDIQEDQVKVTTNQGTVVGSFFIDATGSKSILAKKLGYRKEPDNLSTNSRCIFTHVEGLPPYDELISEEDHPQQSNRLHDGTLHHVFDGGWLWVIPFDNFDRSNAKNASIGLMLDNTKYPVDESLSPEEEFHSIISQFPDIDRHLQPTEPIRRWVRTGRLQRTSSQTAGHRHYMTNNTYGFIDPLYSNGLINTFESIFLATHILLDAFNEDDFSAERFAPLNQMHKEQIMGADFMISNAYKAMGHFKVWNAWTQMWLAQILFHDIYIQRHCFKYFDSGQKSEFDRLLDETCPGDQAPFVAEKDAMYQTMADALDAFVAGDMSPDEASQIMLNEMKQAEWLPKHVYNWGDESARHVDFYNPELVGKLIQWGQTESPDHIREGLFDFKLPEMA
jgi:FADH2 O2-dependent halogenase